MWQDWTLIGCLFLALAFAVYWPSRRRAAPGNRVCDKTRKQREAMGAYHSRPVPAGVDSAAAAGRFAAALSPLRTGKRYVVAGVGFLGGHLVDALIGRGEKQLVLFDLRFSADWEKRAAASQGAITLVRGDLTRSADVELLFASHGQIDVVICTAAMIGYHQNLQRQYHANYLVNVVGIRNLLAAARSHGVAVFVHTSTSHVCLDAERADFDMDETTPVADKSFNHYTTTKIAGGREVLEANGAAMRTGAIRPASAIFGPLDRYLTQKGIVGGTHNVVATNEVVDYVYVKNVVYGLLLLEQALLAEKKSSAAAVPAAGAVSGQAFLVSNNDPLQHCEFYMIIRHFFPAMKIAPLPRWLAWSLAYVSQMNQMINLGVSLGDLDLLTVPAMQVIEADYTFSSAKAQQMLGYQPIYSTEEGCMETVGYYRDLTTLQLKPEFAQQQ